MQSLAAWWRWRRRAAVALALTCGCVGGPGLTSAPPPNVGSLTAGPGIPSWMEVPPGTVVVEVRETELDRAVILVSDSLGRRGSAVGRGERCTRWFRVAADRLLVLYAGACGSAASGEWSCQAAMVSRDGAVLHGLDGHLAPDWWSALVPPMRQRAGSP